MRIIHNISLCTSILVVLFGAYLGMYHSEFGLQNSGDIGWMTVAQFSLLSLCMLLAWWSAPQTDSLRDVRFLLLVAVLVRLLCLPMDSYTSNDIDRYLFDGKIALSGYDPYQINHNASALQDLKVQWQPPEEHAQYPTLYPPLSLGLFAIAASTGSELAPLIWRLMCAAVSILTVLVLATLLQRMGRLRHLSLAALSPILILESGVGAHVDTFSALFVAVALYYYFFGNRWLTGFSIGLGALIKILPIMLIVPLCLGQKHITSRATILGAALATVASGYGVTLFLGFVPVGSIGTLFESWRFGSPLFSLLHTVVAEQLLLPVSAVLAILGASYIAYRSHNNQGEIPVTSPLLPWSMAVVLLASPVVFPWYLMALVPLVVIAPRPFMLIWLCTLPLTYEVLGGFYTSRVWNPAVWPLVLIFLGFVASLSIERRLMKSEAVPT